jgi:glutamyl-tRNA reductase
MLMVDIAVPRDIEEQVGELDDVYLYSVDDLIDIVDENKRSRETEARKADGIIDQGIEDFTKRLRSLNVVSTLRTYRAQAEQIRDMELEKALRQLSRGDEAEQVMTQLARNMANKFMHEPSIALKKAGAEGREDLIGWAHQVFGLSVDDDESQP